MIEDGEYDVVVIDADDGDDAGAVRVEVVVTGGTHKGEVVTLRSVGPATGATALLGLPGTLVVNGGEPRLLIDGTAAAPRVVP